jgi:heavy metal translocating P-type ATPase
MTDAASAHAELRLHYLDGEHDAHAIERGMIDAPGLTEIRVYPQTAKVRLTYDAAVTDVKQLRKKLTELGFPAQEVGKMAGAPAPWRNAKVLTSVASGALLLIGWLLSLAGGPAVLSTTIYILGIVTGGYLFGREAIEELVFEREIGIELLMMVAAIVAVVMGQAAEGAMLAFLYSISEAAESYTEEKTRASIRALMDLTPRTALLRRDGREEQIPVEEIQVGDTFIVQPGQSVATDGEVMLGSSSVNQAPVTGESAPVEKAPGDPVFAGSINGEGALEIRATKTSADNTIARIIHMVEEAQERKGKSQRFIERFGSRYSPSVLALGILIAVGPPLLLSASWNTWIIRATVFIVAAAPCALVISIPVTLIAALGTGARQGVLIKGGVYIEELARITVVALDKTGTLTRGEPQVTEVVSYSQGTDALQRNQVLALAAGIEQRSEHPLARAIVERAAAEGVIPVPVTEHQALTGAGAVAHHDGSRVYVGSPDLFAGRLGVNLSDVQQDLDRLQGEGKTVVIVGSERLPWGLVAIRDNLRANARQAIESLRTMGIDQVALLTGDNERTAAAIGKELGITHVYAELTPEGKVEKVRELAERYGHTAMVGDGVNDAPALAEATVGIAMGAAGTDVALETADVALMADDLQKLAYAIRLAQRTRSVVWQNLALSAVVIGIFVVGAIGGFLSLPIAVLGHEISELVVIGSGLRMLRA